ncbi:cold shock domain-containing protein [Aliarcobacter butzleri]|uniref:cold-shock protein n=1 Tax=Aliarcobacter butzleri TaxID=28197 RepID=UPI00125FCBDB|nr:cold shock domain-containing protein [Aliarcobacter butzleri]MCG3687031.1 cold shock domain-containing protein [Aliarcobacter butzleri]MDN5089460.1 cold shock domain-containing protein [Aliarcobacter butzleri]
MIGTVTSYLADKNYGFIKGEDGKDYFFHDSSLKDKKDINKLCEDLILEFDQKATPKGYSAINISLLDNDITLKYNVPDIILISKKDEIRGWEVIEESDWLITGTSRESPDSAKEDLKDKANVIGANAIFYTNYYKTTGSEAGTGRGTHHFTIHNYVGRAVNIGKKSPNGKYSVQDLTFISKHASELKDYYENKNKKARMYRIIFWLIVILIFIKYFIFVIPIIILIEIFFPMYKEGLWLEKD